MKTLVIYPDYTSGLIDSVFYLLDPDTGEVLASHICSCAAFAPNDLHNDRPERLKMWEEKFGEKTEAKFISKTNYNWDEIYAKNQQLKTKEE